MKIQGQNEEMLYTASQQLMGKSMKEVMHIATETLEGHQRAFMGNMTVEVPNRPSHPIPFLLHAVCTTVGDLARRALLRYNNAILENDNANVFFLQLFYAG